jgi:hypothetical protein
MKRKEEDEIDCKPHDILNLPTSHDRRFDVEARDHGGGSIGGANSGVESVKEEFTN